VSVPPIVSEEIFAAAAEQLERNRMLAKRNRRRDCYLVSGLTVCAVCGFGYFGRTLIQRTPRRYSYAYYQCSSRNRDYIPENPKCTNLPVRVDQLDQYVWQAVRELLEDPNRVTQEWARRNSSKQGSSRSERDEAARVILGHERALKRLVDAFEAGVLDLAELKQRSERIRVRIEHARKELATLDATLSQQTEMKLVVTRLKDFAERVQHSLDELSWQQRQQIIRTVVRRIEIGPDGATIVYRVPMTEKPAEKDSVNCGDGTNVPMTCWNRSRMAASSASM
jgi:site-specific DNA recombinase